MTILLERMKNELTEFEVKKEADEEKIEQLRMILNFFMQHHDAFSPEVLAFINHYDEPLNAIKHLLSFGSGDYAEKLTVSNVEDKINYLIKYPKLM